MKQIRILLLMVFLSSFCACKKNLLDQQSVNLLTPQQVFSNVAGVTAYFASLYRDLPMEDFSFVKGIFWTFPDGGNAYTANWSDEANQNNSGPSINGGVYGDIYTALRNVNSFIQLVPQQTQYDAATQTAWIAEAKFIRAYYYFGLVKYYGGVPLLLVPQATPTPLPRNKEVDIYDQIKKDCEDAAAGLNDKTVAENFKLTNGYTYGYGHANKYAALALEARAMLHAACIGKYGDPTILTQYNGINGVDAAHTTIYFQAAFDAAKAIMTGGKYSLYMKYPADLQKNFQYLFYDTKQGDSNSEAILCRGYDFGSTSRTHSNDLLTLPDFIKSAVGYGSALEPSLDYIERFQNADGTEEAFGQGNTGAVAPGQINVNYHFATLAGPYQDVPRDSRLGGSVVLNGTQFRNSPTVGITGFRGVIFGGSTYTSGTKNSYFDKATLKFSLTSNATSVVGTGNSDANNAPGWLKKWVDPVSDISLIRDYTSRTSWMDLRYGEVLLDYAEASFELGHPATEAGAAINLLRARAGVAAYPGNVVTLAQIRREVLNETGFENKVWWDYIRWRSFGTDFTNRTQYGVYTYWDIDTNDWVFVKTPVTTNKNYVRRQYYQDIPGKELTTDPLLSHNPDY